MGADHGAAAGAHVVVPVEAAAPPSAPAAAGTTAAAWARVSARVTWAGAAAPPAGAAAAGAPVAAPVAVAAAAAARAPPPAWTRLSGLLALAAALFLLGCAAAGLAFFAMILPPAGTAGEVARLRRASEYLLLAASTQMLAATMGVLVPARPMAALGTLLGWLTAYRATDVLSMLVTYHDDSATGMLAFHFWLFFAVLCAALLVGAVVSLR